MIDFSQIKFRASSWGNLLTSPVSKADKEAGKLSATCQKELIKIYCSEVYGRKKDITTKQMDKGILAEDDSIALFSKLEGRMYYKNDTSLQNEWFSGHPDIFLGDNIENASEVSDIKTSWALDTFMPKLIEEPDNAYVAQLNAYYSLTGAQGGYLVYCLVSAPESVIDSEKRSLLFRMNVATEYSPEYLEAVAEMERLMIFEDIPEEHRVIKHFVPRDEELIQKMKDKVPVMRTWLKEFHKKHLNQYPK